MRILALPRYGRQGASSRLRSFQYFPHLLRSGVDLSVVPLLGDNYVSALNAGHVALGTVATGYLGRIGAVTRSRGFDAIWLEKEAFPWLPEFIERRILPRGVPIIADLDDAVFHRYDLHSSRMVRQMLGSKVDDVMRRAALVIVGNEYLGERARLAGAKRVEVVPTVVDADRYAVTGSAHVGSTITIGWIGSPSTAKYLRSIGEALQSVSRMGPVRMVAVGANAEQLGGLSFQSRDWTEANEVADVQGFDIGIMPLSDGPFERGKCGYKLIQYMACGKPVVASPVGVNRSIVEHGVNGYLAATGSEWKEALLRLVGDAALRKRMGEAGRARVEKSFSLGVMAPHMESLLRSVVS